MGGRSIFRVTNKDSNANVIFETMTNYSSDFCIAQKFIPEISQGDKRILLIEGEPFPMRWLVFQKTMKIEET